MQCLPFHDHLASVCVCARVCVCVRERVCEELVNEGYRNLQATDELQTFKLRITPDDVLC